MQNKYFFYTIKVQTSQKILLLNMLSKAKIRLFDLKTESNYITFTVKSKDVRKTFAILKNMCYNYYVCDKQTVKTKILNFCKRLGFVLSFLLSLSLAYLSSNIVLGVKVLTDDIYIKEQIQSLEQVSNFSPCFSNLFPVETLRENVRNLPCVAECSIRVNGNYVEVSVLPAPKEEERNPVYSSYVAVYDATITEIIAHKGTSLVKVGQRVFAGTQLLSPYAYNENGEQILQTGIVGKVYGEVVFSKTLTISKTQVQKIRTGNRQVYTSLALSPTLIPSPYEFYERQTQTSKFNIFLPVYYTKTTYEEMVERVVEVDIEKFCQTALYDFAIEKGIVGEKQAYSFFEENGQYKIYLFIQTITEIGFGE